MGIFVYIGKWHIQIALYGIRNLSTRGSFIIGYLVSSLITKSISKELKGRSELLTPHFSKINRKKHYGG